LVRGGIVVSVFSREWMTRVNLMETQLSENSSSLPGPLPARMLNEFTYCPRLAYLEWVQGEWADSADIVDGQFHHRRVNQEPKRRKPEQAEQVEEPTEKIHARSVHLTSERLGLTAKIDLVEGEGSCVTPVEYKRSKRPHVAQGAWEPERVQVCAQGLLLREHGYVCERVLFTLRALASGWLFPSTMSWSIELCNSQGRCGKL
jgi:hypothetical protein